MRTVEYAIGYLYNDPIDDEALPICVLVNDPHARPQILPIVEADEIEAFDPDASGEFIITYVHGMDDELEDLTYGEFHIANYSRPYVNSVRFGQPEQAELAEGETIEDVLGLA